MSYTKEANDKNFSEILKNTSKVVVRFSASWCGPCKMIAPIMEELAGEMQDINFLHVDIDDASAEGIVSQHNIQMVPTMVFYLDGKIVKQVSGFFPKEKIVSLMKENGL